METGHGVLALGLLAVFSIGCPAAPGTSTSGPASPQAGDSASTASGPSASTADGEHAKIKAEMKAAGVGAEERGKVITIIERDVKDWNKHLMTTCGIEIEVGLEFDQYVGKKPDVGQAFYSCVRTLEGIRNMCDENDAFKEEVVAKIQRVRCWYHESEELTRESRASFALEEGTLRMGFGGKIPTNIMTTTQKFLRKAL